MIRAVAARHGVCESLLFTWRRLPSTPRKLRAVRTFPADNGCEQPEEGRGWNYRLRLERRKGSCCAAAHGALAPHPLRGRRIAWRRCDRASPGGVTSQQSPFANRSDVR